MGVNGTVYSSQAPCTFAYIPCNIHLWLYHSNTTDVLLQSIFSCISNYCFISLVGYAYILYQEKRENAVKLDFVV